MSDVRTFRAATMEQALDLVREELGADAVILHTRQIERKRFLPWRKRTEEVEITASLTLDAPAPDQRRPRRVAADSAPERPPRPALKPAVAPVSRHLDLLSEPPSSIDEMLQRALENPALRRVSPKGASTATLPPQPARPEIAGAAVRLNRFTGRPFRSNSSGNDAAEIEGADPTSALARRLDAIQQMLLDLGRSSPAARHDEIPSELFQLYTELIDAEVEDEIARDLIFKFKRSAAPQQLSDGAASKALLAAMLESEIRCCEPILPRPGRRKVVALVGATGVGKTTTIAKLAANFRLRSAVKMGLVTVDTYRVAAVEQLRTYAEIIDLPMKVVTNPLEMRRALDELVGLDLVLIDTAGRSPKDELQIQELKSLLAEAHVDEVDLVVSMTSSLRSLESAAAKFAAAGTTGLILTKLDEASGMGGLLSVARRIKLPIRYFTAGQDVPDDIESANPKRIARLILGQERAAK